MRLARGDLVDRPLDGRLVDAFENPRQIVERSAIKCGHILALLWPLEPAGVAANPASQPPHAASLREEGARRRRSGD